MPANEELSEQIEMLEEKREKMEEALALEREQAQERLSQEKLSVEDKIKRLINKVNNRSKNPIENPNENINQLIKKMSLLEKKQFKKYADELKKIEAKSKAMEETFDSRINEEDGKINAQIAEINNLIKINNLINNPAGMKRLVDEMMQDILRVEAAPYSEENFRKKWHMLQHAMSATTADIDLSDVRQHLISKELDNRNQLGNDASDFYFVEQAMGNRKVDQVLKNKEIKLKMRYDFSLFLKDVIKTLPSKKVEAAAASSPLPSSPSSASIPLPSSSSSESLSRESRSSSSWQSVQPSKVGTPSRHLSREQSTLDVSSSSKSSSERTEPASRVAPIAPLEKAQAQKKQSAVQRNIEFFNKLAEGKSEASKPKHNPRKPDLK